MDGLYLARFCDRAPWLLMRRPQLLALSVLTGAFVGDFVFFAQPFTGWILPTIAAGAAIGAGVGGVLIACGYPGAVD